VRERVEGGEGGQLTVKEGGIQVGGQEKGRVGEVEGGMVEGRGRDSGRGTGRGTGGRSKGTDERREGFKCGER